MRILVADDDRLTRELVVSTVRKLPAIDVIEAADGDEVFGHLVESQVDALILDWEMPGRSGLEIARTLRNVQSRLPILIVSANAEKGKVIEAIRCGVSDYVVKPFDMRTLLGKVERVCRLASADKTEEASVGQGTGANATGAASASSSGSMESASGDERPLLTAILRHIDDVSTIPEMAGKIFEVANNPEASIQDLSAVISHDPALTSRLLRLVNSSAFGLSQRVSKVSEAVSYLGLNQVRDLAVAISVSDVFRGKGALGDYSRPGLWRHMVAVGLCSRLIAKQIGLAEAEDAFLAGLLHDIGIVLEDQYAHQPFCTLLRGLNPDQKLVEQERQFLAFDHTTLGGRVAEKWKFPQTILNAIRYHHNSQAYQDSDRSLVRSVEFANMLCAAQGHYSVHPDMLNTVSAEDLELPLDSDATEKIRAGLERELEKSSRLLEL